MRTIKDILFGKQVYYYDSRMKPEWADGLYTVDIYSCRRNGKFAKRVAVTPPTDNYRDAMLQVAFTILSLSHNLRITTANTKYDT